MQRPKALRLGEGAVSVHSKGLTFVRQGLSKQDRQGHSKSTVFIPAYKENKHLDPKRALSVYLKKTEEFRKKGNKDETALFFTINSPHDKASVRTLGSYIVNTIQEAYADKTKKVKAHSTRSLGPSWVLFNGASIKSVLEATDWSKETTVVKLYLRNVQYPMF